MINSNNNYKFNLARSHQTCPYPGPFMPRAGRQEGLLWFSPGLQLSITQPLAHPLPLFVYQQYALSVVLQDLAAHGAALLE